jgi:cytoskeleton protein RodZ
MPSIGDTLREARMRQRLDIADVEAKTKIRAKYLRALENEEFGMLPGPTFVKTFLRTYAEVLGVDAHLLVDEYRTHHEPTEEDVEMHGIGAPPREREGPRLPGPPRPGILVLAGVVALLALLLVLGLTGNDDGSDERAARTETARERPATETERERPAAPASVTLRVSPTVPTYACVDEGEGTDVVFEGILEDPRSFKARKLRVNLGKTSVELRANGKAVPIEQGPNPAGYEFTPSGMKELPVGERPCA